MSGGRCRRGRRGLLFGAVLLPLAAAQAAVTLPGGDTLLDGGFDEVNYGDTGLAYVTPYLYVGDLASTESPSLTDATTNLTYGYSTAGLGTGLFGITYSLRNDGGSSFTDLRFIVQVQADGSSSFTDQAVLTWGAGMAGDPDQYQIADFGDGLNSSIVFNNGLDGSDSCGGVCDVDFALQWNLPQIAPGEEWLISVGLSDDGSILSSRYLQAISVDTANTELTFSGSAQVVPLPPAALLMLSGLLGLGGLARRRG